MVNDDDGETKMISHSPGALSDVRLSSEVIQTVYAAYAEELLAFLSAVLRDVSAAQDVLQITFRRLVEVGQTARQETLKGWIFKVALREALVFRRQDSRRERHLKEYSWQREASLLRGECHDMLVNEETITRVKQLLSQLPADQEFVVRQRIYEEKTFATIADELNVPLGTVLTRMRLALDKVRKGFAEREGFENVVKH